MKTPIIVIPTDESRVISFFRDFSLSSPVCIQTFSSSECVRQLLLWQAQMVFGNIPKLAWDFNEQWQITLKPLGDIVGFWKGNDDYIEIPNNKAFYKQDEYDQRPYRVEKLPWVTQIPIGMENRFPVELRLISDEFPDTGTDDFGGITSLKEKKKPTIESLLQEMAYKLNDILYRSSLYRRRYPRG